MLIVHGSIRLSKDHECINDTAVVSHFLSMTIFLYWGQYRDICTAEQQTHNPTTTQLFFQLTFSLEIHHLPLQIQRER